MWELNITNTLRWRDLPKPNIAQVQGYGIMGGLYSHYIRGERC